MLDLEKLSDDEVLGFLTTFWCTFEEQLSGIRSGPKRAEVAQPAYIAAARAGFAMLSKHPRS